MNTFFLITFTAVELYGFQHDTVFIVFKEGHFVANAKNRFL